MMNNKAINNSIKKIDPSPGGDACILGFNKNTEGGRGEPEGMLGQ